MHSELINLLSEKVNSFDPQKLRTGDFLYLKLIQLSELSCDQEVTKSCYNLVAGSDSHSLRQEEGKRNRVDFGREVVWLEIKRNQIWSEINDKLSSIVSQYHLESN